MARQKQHQGSYEAQQTTAKIIFEIDTVTLKILRKTDKSAGGIFDNFTDPQMIQIQKAIEEIILKETHEVEKE